MPPNDESVAAPTMYSIISRVGHIGSDVWTEAPQNIRLPVRRILVGLVTLSELTGWELAEVPGRLGCNYEDDPLDDVALDLLHDSGDFIEGLVRLLDHNRPKNILSGPSATLVIDAHAEARKIVQGSALFAQVSGPIRPRPGHTILGVTVSLVARSSEASLAPASINDLVDRLVAEAALAKPKADLYAAETRAPLWCIAAKSDLQAAYDVLLSRVRTLKSHVSVPAS